MVAALSLLRSKMVLRIPVVVRAAQAAWRMNVRRVGAYILFVDAEFGRVNHEINGGLGPLSWVVRWNLSDGIDQDVAHFRGHVVGQQQGIEMVNQLRRVSGQRLFGREIQRDPVRRRTQSAV